MPTALSAADQVAAISSAAVDRRSQPPPADSHTDRYADDPPRHLRSIPMRRSFAMSSRLVLPRAVLRDVRHSRLAACRYKDQPGVYLFYCDEGWTVVTDTFHGTVEGATDQARHEFESVVFTPIDNSSWPR